MWGPLAIAVACAVRTFKTDRFSAVLTHQYPIKSLDQSRSRYIPYSITLAHDIPYKSPKFLSSTRILFLYIIASVKGSPPWAAKLPSLINFWSALEVLPSLSRMNTAKNRLRTAKYDSVVALSAVTSASSAVTFASSAVAFAFTERISAIIMSWFSRTDNPWELPHRTGSWLWSTVASSAAFSIVFLAEISISFSERELHLKSDISIARVVTSVGGVWFLSIWSFIRLSRSFLEPVVGSPSSRHARRISANDISTAVVVLMLKVSDACGGIETKARQAMSGIWTKTRRVMDEILIKT